MDLTYILKSLNESDINSALFICDIELGKGYLNFETLKKLVNNKNTLVIGAFDLNNKMLGFGYCTILKQAELEESMHSSQYKKIPQIIKTPKKIGITNTIVILNNYKGKGLGSVIFNNFLTFFKENSIDTVTGFAWKTKEGINMEAIFKKTNFYILEVIQNFWREDSIEKKYNCPDCGAPPCNCSTVIYLKKHNHI